jgi:hypothetical protein
VSDALLRKVLWAAVFYNLAGSLAFAFPSSVGQLAGLPLPVPPIYSVLLAFFVVLFGAAYAWLALQPQIDRPLVAMAACGKASVPSSARFSEQLSFTICSLDWRLPSRRR